MNNKLANWSQWATEQINSSLKLARFKPSQPLMMSSSTSKWTKHSNLGQVWHITQGNSANDSADQKANSNVSSIVTWPTVMWHYTCITIPSPSIKISRKRRVLTPPPPSLLAKKKKKKIFIHLLRYKTTLIHYQKSWTFRVRKILSAVHHITLQHVTIVTIQYGGSCGSVRNEA